MAVNMSKKDQDALAAAGAAWNEANARGDKAGMEAAHAQAESIRSNYGYSGGADGSQYIPTSKPSTSTGGQYTGYVAADPGGVDNYHAKNTANSGMGMSASDLALLKSYGDAYNNATTDAERQAAHAAAEALRAQYGYSGGGDGSEYIEFVKQPQPGFTFSSAPTYSDPYSSRIDEMLNDILNRDKFSYNAQEDELFKQYRDQYTREGQRAMKDTLGQIAARTGGLASSYATSAAMQQNNYYMQQLSDKIPELYQLAYQMYLDDIDLQVQDLGLLEGASDRQYNRFRDTMADWRDDRDFAYGMYRDDIADGQWQSSFDRGVFESDRNYNRDVFESDRDYDFTIGRAQIDDKRYEEKWAYETAQDALNNQKSDKDDAYDRAMEMLSLGVMPDASVLSLAGISTDQAKQIIAGESPVDDDGGYTPTKKKDSTSLTGGLTGTEYLEKKREEAAENRFWDSMLNLGIGPVSATFVSELADYGGIVENKDGTVSWANGWNAKNYEEKLKAAKALAATLSGKPNFTALPTLNLGN